MNAIDERLSAHLSIAATMLLRSQLTRKRRIELALFAFDLERWVLAFTAPSKSQDGATPSAEDALYGRAHGRHRD